MEQQLVVTANKLNKRNAVPQNLPQPIGIVGTLNKGFTFLGTEADAAEIPNAALGKWFKDRDGNFYWGGGLMINLTSSDNFLTVDKKDWGFIDYKIDSLWKLSKGRNIQVAILDSGLNYNLDDFKNKSNITYYNACIDSEKKEDCLDDLEGHGTDCAAIACAQGINLFGVAPDITLNVIKIKNDIGEIPIAAILIGLEKAIALNSDVISMSFSVPKIDGDQDSENNIEKLHQIIIEASSKNIALLASADDGNLNFSVNNFPASFPECLSIGSVDKSREVASNESDFLDLMGPGRNVFSITKRNELDDGASFSTPFVAGVVALLKSIAKNKNQPISNIQLFDILKRSADVNLPNYNKIEYGWGIIKPELALNLLQIIINK